MAEMEDELIDRIQAAVRNQRGIPAPEARSWLQNSSLSVLTAATDVILEHPEKIEPRLTLEETCEAVRNYYKKCLYEDVESEFVPSFHIAGYELVRWFRNLWNDTSVPRSHLTDLKVMLAEMYKAFDQKKADRLVNAVIEHLFETPAIVDFFSDWKIDPALVRGYARALEWVEKRPS